MVDLCQLFHHNVVREFLIDAFNVPKRHVQPFGTTLKLLDDYLSADAKVLLQESIGVSLYQLDPSYTHAAKRLNMSGV